MLVAWEAAVVHSMMRLRVCAVCRTLRHQCMLALHRPHTTHSPCFLLAHYIQVRVGLPEPPKGHKWCRVVDTNLASPKDFTPGGNAGG